MNWMIKAALFWSSWSCSWSWSCWCWTTTSLTSISWSKKAPSTVCVSVCWCSWIRKWWRLDWIENIYPIGSQECIGSVIHLRLCVMRRLDHLGTQFGSGSNPSAVMSHRDMSPMSCHVGSCKCQSIPWHVTDVMTCHDVTCRRMSFRASSFLLIFT